MNDIEILIIAIGLAMDAFAVSVGKGLTVRRIEPWHLLCVGFWFGGFQCLMPLVGYQLGTVFSGWVQQIDHWIAFILLGLIGFNMIRESFSNDDDSDTRTHADFSVKTMMLMAIATSIDALAVGVSFAFFGTTMLSAAIIIGIVTFILSAVGLIIGHTFGNYFQSKAEFMGGLILCLLGLKILIEHTCL